MAKDTKEPVKVVLLVEVERHAREAQKRGDHKTHSILHDISVALGGLQHKAREAIEHLEGDALELVGKIESL